MNSVLAKITQSAHTLALQLLQQKADACDVVQDAAIIAITHPSAPSISSVDFKPWFFRVVRNKAIDRQRQTTRRQNDESFVDEAICSFDVKPEQALVNQQLQHSVQAALAQLPAQQREIILLKDYHGLAYADIAKVLGVPKGSVMSRLHRARMALKALLSPVIIGDENEKQ